MTYLKPEVMVLGNATCVIEQPTQKVRSGIDNSLTPNPAYDLDE